MFEKINTSVKILVGGVVLAAIAGCSYLAYTANERMVECKTDNFYYIYGVQDESNVILLKPKSKLNAEELEALGDAPDGLIMVDAVISDEAKQNYMFSADNIDVYGIQNTYVYEAGVGPFKHTFEKVMDVLYLTDNTAIKLGLKEGELNYVFVNEDGKVVDQDGNIVRGEDGEEIIAEPVTDDGATVEDTVTDGFEGSDLTTDVTPEEISESVETEADTTENVDVKN